MEFFSLRMASVLMMTFTFAIVFGLPSAARNVQRIDTHQHFFPEFYTKLLRDLGYNSGGAPIPDWSEESALQFMCDANITKSIVSISAPGAFITADVHAARKLARRLNEYGHELGTRNPGKFGFFASLTLPDVEGSVAEAKYALDVLQADGVILMANSDGTYLGNSSLDPLMEVLNERNAVVFVHPDSLPGPGVPGIPSFVADFLLDTVRAAINLLLADTFEKYPCMNFILPHGGGFLPYAAYRISGSVSGVREVEAGTVMTQMKNFYLDTALSATATVLPSLLTFNPDHVVYGSDFPFATLANVALFNGVLASHHLLNETSRENLNVVAAQKLFSNLEARRLTMRAY